mmetsp:Transcript_12330/g.18937  ORF Transcript_12330/g.18937 Transcript_12330/m.18937 type:complete len:269 (+) Transcript_12330:522-1328(+)
MISIFTGAGFSSLPRLLSSRATFKSFAQKAAFFSNLVTSLISNMIKPENQIQIILTTVSRKLVPPINAKSDALLSFSFSATAPVDNNSEYTKQRPAFTAGGSKDAEIATPTKLLVLPPSMDRQTPIPEGIAIAIPTMSPSISPLLSISSVGHSSAIGVKDAIIPARTPITTQIIKAISSFRKDDFTNGQSRIWLPNVSPRTGPMIGDTSIEATITVTLFVINPIPAKILAITRRAWKSNVQACCSAICSRTCSIRSLVAAFFHSFLAS